jgi:tetratricopeptide (TPR) repeat protein
VAPDDWYRSPDWSDEAQASFEEKLKRSRPHKTPQYLRIKALALFEAGDKSRREAGRTLLHRFLRDYPDSFDVTWAHEFLADAYREDGFTREAEGHYRQAIRMYEKRPSVRGYAQLGLADLILETEQGQKYLETETLLDSIPESDLRFHNVQFKWAVLRARLAARLKKREEAADYASAALRLATITEPQFPRHPDVGLVTTDPETLDELRQLTARP